MFGLFKKRPTLDDLILVSVKSAILLRDNELRTGAMTHPDVINIMVGGVSKKMSVKLGDIDFERVVTFTMAFLMEQKFVERLLKKAMNEGVGEFSEEEEREIMKIIQQFL